MSSLRPVPSKLLLASVGVLALLGCVVAVPPAFAQQSDPVDYLQLMLKSKVEGDPGDEVYNARKTSLMDAAAKLQTASDLRLALALSEWQDSDSRSVSTKLAQVDQEVRAAIGHRLQDLIKTAVDKGDGKSRLAVANLVGEIGVSIRALNPADSAGFARSLAPNLITLMRENNPAVRQAAARALGKINPEPAPAVKALEEMMHSRDVGDRRAASEALVEMVRVVFQSAKKNRAQAGAEPTEIDVAQCAEAVVPATASCLKDEDNIVRRHGLEALVQSATALLEFTPGTGPGDLDREKMPPTFRGWTEAERNTVRNALAFLELKEKMWGPLLEELKNEGNLIAHNLTDKDPQVRVLALNTLELMGRARLVLNSARDVIPVEKGTPERVKRPDLLKDGIQPGLLIVAQRVRDPNKSVRAATVGFLEQMEDAAAPAIPALLAALSDSDRFIRWAAVRTLGKIGKVDTDRTVPEIAKLLNPREDPDVREAAANTLRLYGPAAKAALPALINMLNVGEAEAQEAVIKAITGIGGFEANDAIPALIKSLDSRSPNVRKLAAEALGRMGPQGAPALTALDTRQRVEDDNNVRLAISEAILEITRPRG